MKKWEGKILIVVFGLLMMSAAQAVWADLEWINGGIPKSTPDKTGSNVVKDAPGEDSHSSTSGNQDIVVSHLTTCTKIVNQYPVDSVNYFYLNKNNQICYFAYFLLKPSSRIHTATVEFYSPSNLRIAKYDQEFRVGFVDRLLTLQNETYQWFLVNMTVGMDHLHAEFGQTGLPKDIGLYTVHLIVDGQLVGITFFYVKPEETKAPPPIATVGPAMNMKSGNALPMSTPLSTGPIQRNIQ